mgnify:CR=1 FL=1
MIFCLGDDILESLYNSQDIPNIEDLFQQFFNIITSDYNILIAQSNLIISLGRNIISNEKYSDTIRRVIRYCYSSFTSNYQLLDKVQSYSVITLQNIQNMDDNIYYLCKNYIENKNIKLNEKISFVSENSDDCLFYKYICENYTQLLKQGISLELRDYHGGGASIGKEFERLVKNGEITLAICDSDKFYPNSNFGQTAINLKDSFDNLHRLGNLHMCHYILEVAEKENLIMPSEYIKFYEIQNDNKFQAELQHFLEIENSDFNNFLTFLDLKDGIKKKIIMEDKEYFMNLFEKFPRIFELDNFNNLNSKEDNDIVIKKTERKILPNLYDSLIINTSPNVYVYNFRKKIADLLFCFGISQQKQILI